MPTDDSNESSWQYEYTVFSSTNKIYDPAWSPDASQIAFIWQSPAIDIFLMNSSGDTLRRINRFYKKFNLDPCSVSPDGLYFYYVDYEWNNKDNRYNCYLYSLIQDSSLSVNKLIPLNIYDIKWSMDSHMIYYLCKRNYLHNIDVKTREGDLVFTAVLDSALTVLNYSLAPDNRRIVWSGLVKNNRYNQLWYYTPDYGQQKLFATDSIDYFNPSWSSDGNSLAFISYSYKTRSRNLNIYSFADDSLRTIFYNLNMSSNYQIVWSRDGETLYFVSYINDINESDADIWQVSLHDNSLKLLCANPKVTILKLNADGTFFGASETFNIHRLYSWKLNEKKLSLIAPETDNDLSHPVWNPDGSELVFSMQNKLYKVTAEGGLPKRMKINLSNNQYNAAFYPDGSILVFDDNINIYTVSTDGGDVKKLSLEDNYKDMINPYWSPDGGLIACVTRYNETDSLVVFNYNDGKLERAMAWPGCFKNISWSNPYPGLGSLLMFSEANNPDDINTDYELKVRNIETDKLWTLVGEKGILISETQNYLNGCWAPDAESIAWIQNKDYYTNKFTLNIAHKIFNTDDKE